MAHSSLNHQPHTASQYQHHNRCSRHHSHNWMERGCLWITPIILLLSFSLSAFASHDNEWHPGSSPSAAHDIGLLFETPEGIKNAPLLDTSVSMHIAGLISRSTVRQTFTNPSQQWIHGRYIFPLPQDAAVDHLRLWVGERVIEGDIKPKELARQQYQAAQQSGKKASLVEQHRPNIFSTQVANIAPGETVIVEIEYQQSVSYEGGLFSLRFPSVVAPRYIPHPVADIPQITTTHSEDNFDSHGWGTATVSDAADIPPLYQTATENDAAPHPAANLPLQLTISLAAGLPLQQIDSPSHTIKVSPSDNNQYHITLNDGAIADRDFVLNWRPSPSQKPQSAFFQQRGNDGKRYGLLMLLPPQPSEQLQHLPRHLTFVLDISGSMHGESIKQAKQALRFGLSQLNADDTFNVIVFNHHARTFSDYPLMASPANIQQAQYFVSQLDADGGTEISTALNLAFNQETNRDKLEQIVFITDGSVGNEESLFEQIRRQRGERRLFTVGIGSAPNGYFMTRAAMIGKGTYTYIGQISEVEQQMNQLFSRLRHPVMRDIGLRWNDGTSVDHWPQPLPDLYLQQPLVVSFIIPEGASHLEIYGLGQHQRWLHTQELPPAEPQASAFAPSPTIENDDQRRPSLQPSSRNGIDVLWARNKISSIKLNPHLTAQEKQNQITAIGLDFHLVTDHTSLIAVDKTPSRPSDSMAQQKSVPPHMPKGWDMASRSLAQTGLASTSLMAFGLLCLLLAGLGFRSPAQRKKHQPQTPTALVP